MASGTLTEAFGVQREMQLAVVVPWLSRVYVICTLSAAVLCIPYIKLHSGYRSNTPYRSHGTSTADLYCSARNCQLCVHNQKDTTVAQQCSCTLGYMDVPWLQRHGLVYMGFVHSGGTFQTPMHYGSNRPIPSVQLCDVPSPLRG